MIKAILPFQKLRITEPRKAYHAFELAKKLETAHRENKVIPPVTVLHDPNSGLYLVYNGNGRTIGHQILNLNIPSFIVEENDPLSEIPGSLYRLGPVYCTYQGTLTKLREKVERTIHTTIVISPLEKKIAQQLFLI